MDRACKHCGGWVGYFKSDTCSRQHCVDRVNREQKFVKLFKGKPIRDALLGARRMGIGIGSVAELLDLDCEAVDFAWDMLRQDAK